MRKGPGRPSFKRGSFFKNLSKQNCHKNSQLRCEYILLQNDEAGVFKKNFSEAFLQL